MHLLACVFAENRDDLNKLVQNQLLFDCANKHILCICLAAENRDFVARLSAYSLQRTENMTTPTGLDSAAAFLKLSGTLFVHDCLCPSLILADSPQPSRVHVLSEGRRLWLDDVDIWVDFFPDHWASLLKPQSPWAYFQGLDRVNLL